MMPKILMCSTNNKNQLKKNQKKNFKKMKLNTCEIESQTSQKPIKK